MGALDSIRDDFEPRVGRAVAALREAAREILALAGDVEDSPLADQAEALREHHGRAVILQDQVGGFVGLARRIYAPHWEIVESDDPYKRQWTNEGGGGVQPVAVARTAEFRWDATAAGPPPPIGTIVSPFDEGSVYAQYNAGWIFEKDPETRAMRLWAANHHSKDLARQVFRNRQAGRPDFEGVQMPSDQSMLGMTAMRAGTYGEDDLRKDLAATASEIQRRLAEARAAPPHNTRLWRGMRMNQEDVPKEGDVFHHDVASWTPVHHWVYPYNGYNDDISPGNTAVIMRMEGSKRSADITTALRGAHGPEHLAAGSYRVKKVRRWGGYTNVAVEQLPDELHEPHQAATAPPLPAAGPMTITYLRNPSQAGKPPAGFGQEVEPHGRYVTQTSEGGRVPEGWESGTLALRNPLHVYFGGSYGDPSNWKNELSRQHGGLVGRALSDALVAAGHDGIVTHDEYGTSEIVDLTGLMPHGLHRQAAAMKARDTMSSPLLHRGVHVEVDPDDLLERHEAGGMTAVYQHIAEAALNHPGGVGTHWSRDEVVARRFAHRLTATVAEGARTALPYPNTMMVPVVLHGRIPEQHHETDPEKLRDAMVIGHGWSFGEGHWLDHEDEVLAKLGAPVHVHSVEAALPVDPSWMEKIDAARWEDEPGEPKWRDQSHAWQALPGQGYRNA